MEESIALGPVTPSPSFSFYPRATTELIHVAVHIIEQVFLATLYLTQAANLTVSPRNRRFGILLSVNSILLKLI